MSIIPPAIQVSRIPFSLFFPPQEFGDKVTLCSRLRDAAGVLDGEQLILPVPANGAPDLPRVQLESRDKTYLLQLMQRRMNFEFIRRASEPWDWDACSGPYFDALGRVLRVFIGEYVRPTRFALNTQFLHRLDSSANEFLTTNIIHPQRTLGRPASVKISLLDQFVIEERGMNLWMNITTARRQDQPTEDHGLVIHFDFNSAAEDQRPVQAEQIMAILARGSELMGERLRAFFSDLFNER